MLSLHSWSLVYIASYACKNIVVKFAWLWCIYNIIMYIYIWYMCYWRLRCTFLFISMYMSSWLEIEVSYGSNVPAFASPLLGFLIALHSLLPLPWCGAFGQWHVQSSTVGNWMIQPSTKIDPHDNLTIKTNNHDQHDSTMKKWSKWCF